MTVPFEAQRPDGWSGTGEGTTADDSMSMSRVLRIRRALGIPDDVKSLGEITRSVRRRPRFVSSVLLLVMLAGVMAFFVLRSEREEQFEELRFLNESLASKLRRANALFIEESEAWQTEKTWQDEPWKAEEAWQDEPRQCTGPPADTVGDATSALFAPAMGLVGKGGSLTLTSLSDMTQNDISLNTVDFAMSGKHLHGSIYGYCNPRADIPKLLRLYDQGKLKLDELVTEKYALDDINEGYRALHAGEIIRGLIDYSM